MAVIQVKNLRKHFGKVKAVDGVSFEVEKGEIFGFLGPNGAGKTTTIRCMMDFIRPTSGSIKIFGKDAHEHEADLKHRIGYMSDSIYMYDKWTGQMHIDYFRKLNGKKDWSVDLIDRLNFDPSKKTKSLSSGNRRKLGLILALMHKPDLLVLDEPTGGLDPLLQNVTYELLEEIRENGTTVFMSSHNLPEIERVTDRVLIIRDGKVEALETIKSLRAKRIYHLRVTFKEKVDPKVFEGGGIEVLGVKGRKIELKTRGNIQELVKRLAKKEFSDIEIDRGKLEDIFLDYYQG